MQWLNPAGAWAFAFLAPVVALYLLRKRAKRKEVPSLFLWRFAQNQSEQNRPFQKLKSKLLLWLQLLLVLLLAFGLMRPASVGGSRGETALIFDLSASMQTTQDNQSRMDQAKLAAYEILDAMGDEDAVTVITAGSDLGQPVSRSTDHAMARRVIGGLKAENGTADVEAAVALAQAMGRDLPALSVVVLSDSYKTDLSTVSVKAVSQPADNRGILSLRLTRQETGMTAFAQVQNWGQAGSATLECYGDDVLCDIRTIPLEKDGVTTVRFALPLETEQAKVCFTQGDSLTADDVRYAAAPVEDKRRVLLVTESNIFLEKALGLRSDLTVTKASLEDAENAEGFDLYLYDGLLPETLPASGALLCVNPPSAVLDVVPQEQKEGSGILRAASGEIGDQISQHLLLSDIALRVYHPLEGGAAVLTVGGDTIISFTSAEGRRAAVLGFDLHDSNLPLKADFPVLIQNLLHALLPEQTARMTGESCGQRVTLVPDDRAVSVSVLTPSGRTVLPEGTMLSDTQEIGLYTMVETRADGTEARSSFALHIPREESDTTAVIESVEARTGEGAERSVGYEWGTWILLAALCVLLLEWEVSRRGA